MFTNSHSLLQRATFGAAIAAMVAFSAPSLAAMHDDSARTVTVQYTDLDLSKDKDAATLYRRLQTAARGVCSALRGPELASFTRYKECYANALADAVDTVNVGTLTALHKQPSENRA